MKHLKGIDVGKLEGRWKITTEERVEISTLSAFLQEESKSLCKKKIIEAVDAVEIAFWNDAGYETRLTTCTNHELGGGVDARNWNLKK